MKYLVASSGTVICLHSEEHNSYLHSYAGYYETSVNVVR